MPREGRGWGEEESLSKSRTDPSSQETNQGAGVEGPDASQTPNFLCRAFWPGSWHRTRFFVNSELPTNGFYNLQFLNTQPGAEKKRTRARKQPSPTQDLVPSV